MVLETIEATAGQPVEATATPSTTSTTTTPASVTTGSSTTATTVTTAASEKAAPTIVLVLDNSNNNSRPSLHRAGTSGARLDLPQHIPDVLSGSSREDPQL